MTENTPESSSRPNHGRLKCPAGHDATPNAGFCSVCGQPVAHPVLCDAGHIVADGAAFCSQCGVAIQADAKRAHCQGCGGPVAISDIFCLTCGVRLPRSQSVDAEQVHSSEKQSNAFVVAASERNSSDVSDEPTESPLAINRNAYALSSRQRTRPEIEHSIELPKEGFKISKSSKHVGYGRILIVFIVIIGSSVGALWVTTSAKAESPLISRVSDVHAIGNNLGLVFTLVNNTESRVASACSLEVANQSIPAALRTVDHLSAHGWFLVGHIRFGSIAQHATIVRSGTIDGAAKLASGQWRLLCQVSTVHTSNNGSTTTTTSSPSITPLSESSPIPKTYFETTGGILGLDAAIALLIDAGKLPGSADIDEASANCGPPNTSLALGVVIECGINASAGPLSLFVSITSPNGTHFRVVSFGSVLGKLRGKEALAASACSRQPGSCSPIVYRYVPFSQKPQGGGTIPFPGKPGLMPCVGSPVMKPNQIIIGCPTDTGGLLTISSWESWTTTSASAVGVYDVNTCHPSCGAENYESYPVRVRLAAPVDTKYGMLFSSMVVTAQSYLPNSSSRSETLSLFLSPGEGE